MEQNNKLFLFDIDGTLVNLRSIWEEMYMRLYTDVAGFELMPTELHSKFGPPEYDGHKAILEGRGVYTSHKVDELVQESERRMVVRLGQPDIPTYVLHSVVDCLDFICQKGYARGIVTGNMEPIAEAILQGAGLRDYFSVMGCSIVQTKRRAEIVLRAVQGFEQQNRLFLPQHIYVIGDTPLDVQSAKECGYVSVGVATGHYTRAELACHNPDYLLSDMREFRIILG